MQTRPQLRFALCLLAAVGALPRAGAQDRARDAPFSCEPVVSSSVIFRGFALENYEPAHQEQRVRFQVEERFFGIGPNMKDIEIPLLVEAPIGRGEERIVASLPDQSGPNWTAELFDEAAEKPYLEYLRGLALGKAPARIFGWTSGPDDSPLVGAIVRAVGAGREYEMRSSARGIFEFSGVVPGKYFVTGSRAGFETLMPFQEVEVVPAGCGVVSLPFEFEGIIQGTVRDRHGQPQPGLRVDLVQIDGEDESPYEFRETDGAGVYRFSGIDAGHYRIGINLLPHLAPRQPYPKLYAPGVEEVRSSYDVALSEEQPKAVADLWLPDRKLRRFEIEVFWSDGSPAKQATVALDYGQWHEPGDLRTNDRSALVLQGYEPLDYRIYAYATNARTGDDEFSLPQVVLSGHQKASLRLVLAAKRTEDDGSAQFVEGKDQP